MLEAGNTGDDCARKSDTLKLEPGSSHGPPSLRLTPPGQGTGPPGARLEKRARRERPLGPAEAARSRAFLPVQAEGAAPLVEQAEQQKRGPGQRGVPRRQVLAEGRHGTT